METPRPMPSWKEQARELLHEAILSAARATFAENGYEGATIDEIAARAEVGKGTVYNYVEGGKAGLFAAVFDEHFDDLEALTAEALADDEAPFRERFARFSEAVTTYFAEHLDHLVLHLRDVPRLLLSAEGVEQAARLRRRRDRFVMQLGPPIETAIARGEIRRVPTETVAHFCFAGLLSYLFQTCAVSGATPLEVSPSRCEGVVSLVFDGLAVPSAPATGDAKAAPASP